MKANVRSFLKIAVFVLVPLLFGTGAGRAEEKCGVCHPEERVAHQVSIHAREQIGCTSCHGGVADTLEADEAHGGGSFRALDDRRQVASSCASCHSDLTKMRPYNLPVDQFALYQTSRHGQAFARGELRAATCTDCHSVHEIRAPDDPTSTVYARNLPETCGRCHGDRELMEDVGVDPDVVSDYRSSIHGRRLFDEGNLAAPNCTSCHGVHGAAPPGMSDIDKVCGACHVETRRAYLDGPHADAMEAADIAACVACHSSHAIQPHRAEEIGELCLRCHDKNSNEVDVGEKIHTLIAGATEEIRSAEEVMERARKVPIDVEDTEARIEEARTYLTEALPLAHQVEVAPVEELTRRARAIGEQVSGDLWHELNHDVEYVGLAIFWFYLVITLAILWNSKRRLSRGADES